MVFGDQLVSGLHDPRTINVWLVVALIGAMLAVTWLVHRWLFRSTPGPRSDSRQLEFLASAAGMRAVAGATIIRHDRDYGNALLTRRRVLDVRRHDLSFRRFEPRGALEVDLEVAGNRMRLFVMHLGLAAS